jgi:tetratricopeptide (TPR) repeat protein
VPGIRTEGLGGHPELKLFISRAGADADFAAAIGGILQAAGHTVVLQQWDFANRNFMERMHAALADGSRVVALLSPEYLRSDHCQAEWQNAIADDPLNTKSRLILLRVAECEPTGLLSGLAYWDLVPVRDDRRLLEQIVREAVRDDRRDAAPSGPYWRAPRTIVDTEAVRPVPSFGGREPELISIAAALEDDGAIAAVHGLGGVGKSSVAREYAWRHRERYSVVWWLHAQTEDGIIEGLLRLGALFVRGLDTLADRRAAAQRVVSSVLGGFSKPIVLIFDNLEDERLVRTWLPRTGGRALVTSRNAAWGGDVTPIPLHAWEPETAAGYLQRESGRADLNDVDAHAIVETLGALPLALSHAAASLRNMRMVTPARYVERITEYLKSAPRGAEYPNSVFATFRTAIAQAEAESPGAASILCFAACFAPDAIPDELFRQAGESSTEPLRPKMSDDGAVDLQSALADDLRFDEALGALDRLSLLGFSAESQSYGVHRLVRLAARDLIAASRLAWLERAAQALDRAFPKVEFSTWAQCERLLPHARAVLDSLPTDFACARTARVAFCCGVYLRERGDFAAARPLQQQALAMREKTLGEDHADVAQSLTDLAILFTDQGRYGEAEPLYARALDIWENALGPEHASVGTCLNSIGCLRYEQGRYAEAEQPLQRALAIWEKTLGPNHLNVALVAGNLGGVYNAMGRYAEAQTQTIRALTTCEAAVGPDHPQVAVCLDNVAAIYHRLGQYDEAESALQRAFDIWEKAGYGSEHPDIAITLDVLAALCETLGRLDEAESARSRALEIREKAFGDGHPDVAASLSGLAGLRCRQKRYDEARVLFERALTIHEATLGPEHADLAKSLCGLATVYSQQARRDEATALFSRALHLREEALGPHHQLTAEVREALHDLRQGNSVEKKSNDERSGD